jgi:hypothetical protein
VKGRLQALPIVGAIFRWRDVKPDEVRAFWRHMSERFDTTTVNKQESTEMQLVAHALDLLGILDRDRFLTHFTTTIGRRIYAPFEVGNPQGGWDLWSQVVICVHEHQHVVQHDRDGVAFEAMYLTDRASRARYEAEAYRSNVEMHFWRYGATPSTRRLAELLFDYGCRKEDVEVVAQSLALSAVSVRRGAVMNEATRAAFDWLGQHVARLRAQAAAPGPAQGPT